MIDLRLLRNWRNPYINTSHLLDWKNLKKLEIILSIIISIFLCMAGFSPDVAHYIAEVCLLLAARLNPLLQLETLIYRRCIR